MTFFGGRRDPGPVVVDEGGMTVRARIDRVPGGLRVSGTLRGRGGRIEVYRRPAPAESLVNNWQSWGPMQAMRPGDRLAGLEERMAAYSRFVFTPIPETFLQAQVSDYFIAWDGGLAGFLSSRIAHPFFTVEGGEIVAWLEYFDTPFDDEIPLEPLLVLESGPVEALLDVYGDAVAAENKVRVPDWNPVGWSSWYQYFTELRRADIEKNLRLAARGFPFDVFQIDDGFEADIGDWLEVKDGFCPLPDLAGLVRDHGFSAGIWTAPFSAASTSRLFGAHPGWFVGEPGRPDLCYRNWRKEIFALDTTNPEAKAWLRETFASLVRMGFDYLKIDFLFAAAMPGPRSRRVTPIQALREGLSVIREAAGEAFVLGCGAPLLPSLGFVDGMRVGEDTAPFWDSRMSGIQGPNAYVSLKNAVLRSFMHRRFWLNDPDCLLLRDKDVSLTAAEKALFARAAGVLDNMIIESDDLELVGGQGRRLLEEAIGLRGGRASVRGLLADDAYLIESSGGPAGRVRLAANLSDGAREIEGRSIPPRSGELLD